MYRRLERKTRVTRTEWAIGGKQRFRFVIFHDRAVWFVF